MSHSSAESSFQYIFEYCESIIQIVILAACLILFLDLGALAEPGDPLLDLVGLVEPVEPILAQSAPELTKQDSTKIVPTTPAILPKGVQTLPVGLNINGKNVLPSINVRGAEDGEKAVDFDLWLLPFDEVIDTLKLKVKEADDGGVEIISPLFKFQLPAGAIVKDPQLGRSIAVRDLNTIPGVTAKFDINKYAIDLLVPSLNRNTSSEIVEQPIVFDGLPAARPIGWGVGAIQERVSVFGQNGSPSNVQGEFKAIGNVFDANWYLRVDQSQFDKPQTWNITDGVVIRQRPEYDVVVGSQFPFWRRQNNPVNGSYWGGTTILRQGFTPPVQLFGSDFLVNDRLQSSRIGRSIAGQAFPGTLVQLIRGYQNQVVQEVLVNSSGVYRFDNLVVGNGSDNTFGQDYRVLLYPNGQITASPEIRPAQFVTTPGQIPAGASALVVSAGANRTTVGNFGNFDAAQGGVLYRRGVSESLTVGVGAAFDREVLGVAEVFWQPNNTPLQVAFSATTGKQSDLLGRLDYRPSNDFSLTANLDQFSSRSDVNWKLSPSFTALSTYDSRRGASIGGQYSANSSRYSSTFVRAEIDNQARLRFGANQRLDNWLFSHQSNESASTTQVAYRLDRNLDNTNTGHELVASYQTNNIQAASTSTSISPSFSSLVWRYQAPQRTADGRSLWQSELGYGFSSSGSGILAGLDFSITPGLRLRGSYRGASENGRDSYALELNTTLLTSSGIEGTDSQIDEFRALGQVKLAAFIDTNSNGNQDPGEASYYDPLLFKINQKPLKDFQAGNSTDSATIKLPSGSYRLDIDPAGYPIDYRSSIEALRVDVAAGNVTPISIALVPAYVRTGVILDTKGKPVAGAKIEAIAAKDGKKITSVTNDAGVYYLEALEQGEYRLKVDGVSVIPSLLRIDPTSKSTQEINLTVILPTRI